MFKTQTPPKEQTERGEGGKIPESQREESGSTNQEMLLPTESGEPACFPCDPRKHQHRLNTDCPGSGWAHTDLGPCFTSLEGNLTMLVPTGAQHHAGPLAQEATHPKM